MIVGLDFDNTIARYDGLFHTLAIEAGLIPDDLPANKTVVRDFLRERGEEDAWTEMQGVAYGPRIVDAEPFAGAVATIAALHNAKIETHIVSHKTRTPYRGEPHDLHAAARRFLEHHSISPALIAPGRVHFCLTKEAKLERIAELGCTHFLDDLPEFLGEAGFPAAAQRFLFDPAGRHGEPTGVTRFASWSDFGEHLLGSVAR